MSAAATPAPHCSAGVRRAHGHCPCHCDGSRQQVVFTVFPVLFGHARMAGGAFPASRSRLVRLRRQHRYSRFGDVIAMVGSAQQVVAGFDRCLHLTPKPKFIALLPIEICQRRPVNNLVTSGLPLNKLDRDASDAPGGIVYLKLPGNGELTA